MQSPTFDPGLTQLFSGSLSRIINKDGSFNVRRQGETWRDLHPYLHLINMGWTQFLMTILLAYLAMNVIFATIYFALGPGQLSGTESAPNAARFLTGFFFSAQTLSTVGYGHIAPTGLAANVVAAIESMIGILAFAVATGLLYGRVSRPSARIGFSRNAVVAPYQDGQSLQFRVVNRRRNSLTELETQIIVMTVEVENGELKRKYARLKLERSQVLFLALTWTLVHPIDAESPFWGKTAGDLDRLQAELLILIKGYDDTFNQTVVTRHSYRHDEIVWAGRFAPAFHVDATGDLVLEVSKVGDLA